LLGKDNGSQNLPYTDEVDNQELIPWETMAWSVPRYSRRQIDAAGESLIRPPSIFDPENFAAFYGEAGRVLHIVNNWRASHNWPLYAIRKTLENRAKSISPPALIAQRIKRLPSIEAKLQREQFRHLKLTQIEDIGGCRAVMPTIADAFALVETYKARGLVSELLRARDYTAEPKPDGYRSIHLIYKYRSDSERYKVFDNLRIEIQIRSHLQHLWATALETVETFAQMQIRRTSGSMLLRPKGYLILWRRFFVLTASAFAVMEGQPVVPDTPSDHAELVRELRSIEAELHVKSLLLTWSVAVSHYLPKRAADAYWFLMRLTPEMNSVLIETFKKDESLRAFDEYVSAEKPKRDAPSTQVVLVSVDSINTLQEAYPNYFADTKAFVQQLEEVIK
jgi:hypothetical protein